MSIFIFFCRWSEISDHIPNIFLWFSSGFKAGKFPENAQIIDRRNFMKMMNNDNPTEKTILEIAAPKSGKIRKKTRKSALEGQNNSEILFCLSVIYGLSLYTSHPKLVEKWLFKAFLNRIKCNIFRLALFRLMIFYFFKTQFDSIGVHLRRIYWVLSVQTFFYKKMKNIFVATFWADSS